MRLFLKVNFLFVTAFTGRVYAASVIFNGRDATVWLPRQLITGRVTGPFAVGLKLHCNNTIYNVHVNADETFKVTINLGAGTNKIWAAYTQSGETVTSAILVLTLGYHPLPVVKPFAIVKNNKITLKAQLIDNPSNKPLKYLWTSAANNRPACKISGKYARICTADIPNRNGVYYFNLLVTAGSDSAHFETYVTRTKESLHAYNMDKDHAAWIHSAVIYEINPSVFVKNGSYDAITAKLAEIKTLGINTIWIQPVYKTNDHGQGYAITDFFKLRDDYGTEKQLATLIAAAKKMQLRVIFDFVPNHTSISHPYALDCIKHGDSSHYYNFYQHAIDSKPYSSFYHKDANGFVFYFWKGLVNLNYDGPEVQQWIIEAAKYWLKKFDIDGYRFDTMWGVNARAPQFAKRLQTELKSIKPDILLLAEDKASDKTVYQSGFDAAYDWTADTSWVSQWSWQFHYSAKKSLTIFNAPDSLDKAVLLSKAIFKNRSVSNTSLRFIENNDVPRFIASHSLAQTKMAAALVFSLPGIPMLYNGQEVGCNLYPYSTKTIFTAGKTIRQSDSAGLFSYYKKLIQLHSQHPALNSPAIRQVLLANSPGVMAFERWAASEHFIIVINLDPAPAKAHFNLSNYQGINQLPFGKAYFKDVLTEKTFEINPNRASDVQIPMTGDSIRWLLLQQNNKTHQQ